LISSRVSIVIKENQEDSTAVIEKFVSQLMPSAKLLDTSAGSLLFSVPIASTGEITNFLTKYEDNLEIKSLVEDVSVSNSTLEEVFINVTKEDNSDTEADAPGVGEED
jgi:hypothetical protein